MITAIKTITLYEPWASLMAIEAKQYETRSWLTRYRGLIAIHSGKHFGKEELAFFRHPTVAAKFEAAGLKGKELPFGCVVAIGWLDKIFRTEDIRAQLSSDELLFGNYETGRSAWRIIRVQRIDPIPVKGQMGLWDWTTTDEQLNSISDAIKRAKGDGIEAE